LRRVEALEKQVETDDPTELKAYWNKGLRFKSADNAFTARISGKIHIDTFLMSSDRKLDSFVKSHGDSFDDGIGFRRARIGLSGTLYSRFVYKADYDFSGGSTEFKDVYVGVSDLPGNTIVKVGHFREPFSLQSMTSVSGLLFIERSQLQQLTPSRNTGIAAFGTALDKRATWAVGVFYNTNAYGDGGSDGDISATARVTCLPWYEGDDRLFHAGVAYSRRGEDDIQFKTGPEIAFGPDLVDTDGFATQSPHLIALDSANLYGFESALVMGPFSTHAEYVRVDIDARHGRDADLWSYYAEAGYFLTGEHRSYDKEDGAPGSVKPLSEFDSDDGGLGAFELVARSSILDLDDHSILNGGENTSYTAGINWFLNPSICVSANYLVSRVEKQGGADIFIMRVAFEF
ncbi:MAG: porin, partial [Planctomycetota bacterium]